MGIFSFFTVLKQLEVWQKLFSSQDITCFHSSFLFFTPVMWEGKQVLNNTRLSINALSFCRVFFITAALKNVPSILLIGQYCESMGIWKQATCKLGMFCHFLQTFYKALSDQGWVKQELLRGRNTAVPVRVTACSALHLVSGFCDSPAHSTS